MKFTFTEKNIDASIEVKDYAEKKIGKLEKYFKGDTAAFITFGFKRGRYVVEVTVNGGGTFFRVSETSTSARAAIDSAEAAIESQIHKNKTRLAKRLRSGSLENLPMDSDLAYGLAQEEEEAFTIVRRKEFPVKPMTPEEAILQMNLLNHSFFVFKNAENEDEVISIVYKRKDGGYGLIEAVDD